VTVILFAAFTDQLPLEKYILTSEKDIAKQQPGHIRAEALPRHILSSRARAG
jgi:hypothetical protein